MRAWVAKNSDAARFYAFPVLLPLDLVFIICLAGFLGLANKLFYETIGRSAKGEPGSAKGETAKASIRLISGCQDNQLSYDGAINSAFTAALLLVWAGGKFSGDYGDFHIQIQSKMLPTQSPNHFKVGKQDLAYDRQKPFTI